MNFFKNWTGSTFYWHFVLSLRNLRLAFLPTCIISSKFVLSYWKSNFEKVWFRFYRPKKNASFFIFIFALWRLSNHFCKDLTKKPPVFITNTKTFQNFLDFYKDLRSRNFWQWNDSPLKTLWKFHGNAFSLQISAKFRKLETFIYIETRDFG